MSSHSSKKSSKSKQQIIGVGLLAVLIAAFPFLSYYFGTFYRGGLDDFRNWYPNFYLVLYTLVKILPFAFLAIIAFLLQDIIWKLVRIILKSLHHFFTFLLSKKPSIPKTFTIKIKQAFSHTKSFALNFLLLIISSSIVFSIAEYVARKKGFKAGFRIQSQYFKQVDSLYNLKGFIADSNGVFCISPEAREFICTELRTKNTPEELPPLTNDKSPEVYGLAADFLRLRNPDFQNDFKSYLSKSSSVNNSDSLLYQAIRDYVNCPINSNGFKSIEFKKYASNRKSILLLGDSFTWGHSTSNKTNCFADILLTKGYIVYNTGITGTDPAQYLQIAKILVPLLEPDYVIVNFYMGNDVIFFERKPEPYIPVFYCTNAGNLISCPEGIYFKSAEDAYQQTLSVFTIPAGNNLFNSFCSKTVIGTLLWRVGAKLNLVDARLPQYFDYYENVKKLTTSTPYSDIQVKKIKDLTEQQGGRFLLVVIPSLDGNDFTFPKDKQPIFSDLDYFVPPITKALFEDRFDGHYNDLGHKMHAEFIDSLIKNL